jgi:hypothetical protein
MPMLTAADVADLLGIHTDAQPDTSLVLYRPDGSGGYTELPAQGVQVSYTTRRQIQTGGIVGTEQALADVTFHRESPFDVRIGDEFFLDGHKGGKIRRVTTDPVLGVIMADGDIDVGVAR